MIESFAPNPDAVEIHRIEIKAAREKVYEALWTSDFGSSPVIRWLITLRTLPARVFQPGRRDEARSLTLDTLVAAGFGRLAEEPGREIVLGVAGRFWRPVGNVLPFNEENFRGPVPSGLARAVWNFSVASTDGGRTILTTETRVVCGDAASRIKFRAYWLVVRPFSGLIRLIMLRAVRQACESPSLSPSRPI